jgi:hypothetical protein
MLGQRSMNLELIPLDPKKERTLRRNWRAPVELGDNQTENVECLEVRMSS